MEREGDVIFLYSSHLSSACLDFCLHHLGSLHLTARVQLGAIVQQKRVTSSCPGDLVATGRTRGSRSIANRLGFRGFRVLGRSNKKCVSDSHVTRIRIGFALHHVF